MQGYAVAGFTYIIVLYYTPKPHSLPLSLSLYIYVYMYVDSGPYCNLVSEFPGLKRFTVITMVGFNTKARGANCQLLRCDACADGVFGLSLGSPYSHQPTRHFVP